MEDSSSSWSPPREPLAPPPNKASIVKIFGIPHLYHLSSFFYPFAFHIYMMHFEMHKFHDAFHDVQISFLI